MHTLSEIRTNIADTVRESQINSLIDNYINLTLNEINNYHPWTFNRRKTTLTTAASTEGLVLPRDVDKIGFLRQTTSPIKLIYLPDELFYKFVPYPTATGNPFYYRLWEEEGVSTRLSEADTIDVVSSSAVDGSSFTVSVSGYVAGYRDSEVLTLDGTTTVAGTKTFQADRPLRISKSGKTTGAITVKENSGGTTLVVLAPEERSPRFKLIDFYPIPSSAISVYLEYYVRIRELVNNADVPDFDEKWHWILREGALAKVYQYQNKETAYVQTEARYQAGLLAMKRQDEMNVDYIPQLGLNRNFRTGAIKLSDTVASGYYGSGFGLYF